MVLSKYILDLAEQQSRIPVGGLGTFHFQKVSAQISNFQTIQPPGFRVQFTNDFQGDPFLLAKYIAMVERIPMPIAENKIQNEINALVQILSEGKAYVFDQIGSLKLAQDGQLEFIEFSFFVHNGDTFGLAPLNTEQVQTSGLQIDSNATPKVESSKPQTEKPVEKSNTPKHPIPKPAVEKAKKKSVRFKRFLFISLFVVFLILIFSVFVYLCQFEPQTISISICSEFNSLIPIGEFVYSLIQPNGTPKLN